MTRPKLLIGVTIIFDLLRLFFQLFWFFGPALAALYCSVKVGDVWVVGEILAAGCVAVATAGGIIGAEFITPFGVIMADAIGLIAFLTIGLWIVVTNARILKSVANTPLQFSAAFAFGEIPLLGAFPVFTLIVWRLYSAQIRADKLAHAKWEKENAAAKLQEQQEQMRRMQQQAANDEIYTQAANDEKYNEKEIPEEVRKAA